MSREEGERGALADAAGYLGPTFAVAWGVLTALWVARLAGTAHPPARGVEEAAAVLLMLVPGCVAVALRLLRREGWGDAGLGPPGWRAALLAYALPVAYAGLAHAASWVMGVSSAASEPGGRKVLLLYALSLTVFPLLVFPFVFLEELGWRGYLLPRLLRLGETRAALLSGALWALWRLPLDLLQAAEGRPAWAQAGVAWLAAGLFGTALAWLRLRSGSLWAPALAHAVFFAQMAGPLALLARTDPVLGGARGLPGVVLLALLCAWLVATGRLGRPPS